ncbi:MAG: hypothetical protein ACT4TC_09855 [Myxococcaceae bacterium]
MTTTVKFVGLMGTLLLSVACTRPATAPSSAASVKSFTVSASEVNAGETVTLRWQVENATALSVVEPGSGPLPGVELAAEGAIDVRIDHDSVFLLTASGDGGADVAAVSITVARDEATVLFTVVPAAISAGEPTTVVWNARGATDVTLTANGESLSIDNRATGSLTLRPTQTTLYALAVAGRLFEATVTVGPAIFTFVSNVAGAEPGAQVKLSWTTAGGTQLALSSAGRGRLVTLLDPRNIAAGEWTDTLPTALPENGRVNYTLSLFDGTRELEKELTVFVGVSPVVDQLEVPIAVQLGGQFTVRWKTRNADKVQLELGSVVLHESPDAASAAEGFTVLPSPSAKATLTLRATNARGGSTLRRTVLDPVGPVSLVSFATDKTTVAQSGEPVTLRWNVSQARHVRIETGDGWVVKETTSASVATGSLSVYPNRSTDYFLLADNGAGSAIARAKVSVTVTLPGTLLITPQVASAGEPVSLTGHTVLNGGELLNLPVATKNATGDGFIDIAAPANQVSFTGEPDYGATLVKLPERFDGLIHGTPVSGRFLSISANGWCAFSEVALIGSDDAQLDDYGTAPLALAPYYDDLRVTADSRVYVRQDGPENNRRLIVQWESFQRDGAPNSKLTFQAQLHARGKVVFAYKTLQGMTAQLFNPSIGAVDREEFDPLMAPDLSPPEGGSYTLFIPAPLPFAFTLPDPPYWFLVKVGIDDVVALSTASP